MKKIFLLSFFFCLILHAAHAQIDKSIPTPTDLQTKDITIITKTKQGDGTIVIRYVDKKGRTMQRQIKTAPDGSKSVKEWDEANPPKEGLKCSGFWSNKENKYNSNRK